MREHTATVTATGTSTATATATASFTASAFLINIKSLARVHLNTTETHIGRDTGLFYDGISRKHCVIRSEDSGFSVADMNSKYGTYLNQQKLPPNEWQALKPGDELRLGGMDFLLQATSPRRTLQAPAPKLQTLPLPVSEPVSLWARFRAESLNSILATALATILGAIFHKVSVPVALLELTVILSLVNYIPMILTGQSLGKRITGIKIVMEDGSPVTLGAVLFREILMKSGCLILFTVALMLVGPADIYPFMTLFLSIPALFVWKTQSDGMPFWDPICGTRAINSDSSV